MLQDEKILITGPAGQIASPLAEFLAHDNEVWGLARFSQPGSREQVENIGVTTRVGDMTGAVLSDLPHDFSYVIHLAAFQGRGLDYDYAITANGEGTGLVLQHCRRAKAALVMSTHSVYRPHPDPSHVFAESDPLGDAHATHAPTYSVSKIAQEAVARYCARALPLPVVIARMNASYGPKGGLPAYHLDAIAAGQEVTARWDPCPYSPIYQDDINEQVEPLLAAAGVPATIVNWAGDEAVTLQEWCRYFGELAGMQPRLFTKEVPGTLRGSIADVTKRSAITGPCRIGWKEGMRRTFDARYPGGVAGR